jgi:hypothetical protein
MLTRNLHVMNRRDNRPFMFFRVLYGRYTLKGPHEACRRKRSSCSPLIPSKEALIVCNSPQIPKGIRRLFHRHKRHYATLISPNGKHPVGARAGGAWANAPLALAETSGNKDYIHIRYLCTKLFVQ